MSLEKETRIVLHANAEIPQPQPIIKDFYMVLEKVGVIYRISDGPSGTGKEGGRHSGLEEQLASLIISNRKN
jgi:hypothetical protein